MQYEHAVLSEIALLGALLVEEDLVKLVQCRCEGRDRFLVNKGLRGQGWLWLIYYFNSM